MNNFSLDFPRDKASQRQLKVQEILRAALVEILQRGLTKEPILENSIITITYGFNRANKKIRKEISQRVQLKYTPSLSFVFDDTIKEIRKLDDLFLSNKVREDLKR